MRYVLGMEFLVFSSPEYSVVKTEHIESGHSGYDGHNPTNYRTEMEAGCKDFVFREEARERRYTGNSQTCYKECDVGNRHVFSESAHSRHLIAVHCVDNTSGSQEQKCLKHGVCKQMEHTCHISQSAFVRVERGTYA